MEFSGQLGVCSIVDIEGTHIAKDGIGDAISGARCPYHWIFTPALVAQVRAAAGSRSFHCW